MRKKILFLTTAVGCVLSLMSLDTVSAGTAPHPARVKTFTPSARFTRSHEKPAKAKELTNPSHYENWFNTTYAVTTSAGYAPLDKPTTINCKSANGCTLIVESMAQIQPFADAQASFNPQVDGESLNLAGAYTDVPNSSGFTFINSRANLSIKPGKHTVQTYLYVGYTYYSGDWQIDYTVWSKGK